MITLRTFVLSILIGALVTGPVFGQQKQEKDFKLGVTAGLTSMTYGGADAADAWERRRGKAFGVVTLLNFPDNLIQVQAEARYVQKGARAELQQGTITVRDKLHYFDTSLLGKLPLPVSRSFVPHLLGGLSSSVGFGGQRTYEGPGGTVTETIQGGNSTEWSLAMGVGFDVGMYAPVTLTVDARYVYGLSSAPTGGISDVEAATFRNQGYSLNAGLAISL